MKKLLAFLLCLCLIIPMAACQGTAQPAATGAAEPTAAPEQSAPAQGDEEPAPAQEEMTYTELYGSEVSSLNYLTVSGAWDQEVGANVIDSLVEYNSYAELQPGLALTWENSEDGLTWTFHLREDAKWYDYQGNEVANVTANDFVAAMKYALTPANESATTSQLYMVKNAEAFYNGEITDFAEVGIKALDDYTLEYTLEQATPYFLSALTYVVYFPAYGPQLEELGKDFGTSNDKMYYCGAYLLSEYEPQVKHVYVKNVNNWDADNIFITKIERRYNAESATLAPTMALRGEVDDCEISNDIVDDWKTNHPEMLSKGRTDPQWSYFYCFNFNPTYEEEYAPQDWLKAANNANFRHSIMSAFDRAYSLTAIEHENPESIAQNTITPKTFAVNDGVDFTTLAPFNGIADNYFNTEKALEYKAKAMEELTAQGVTFPIQMIITYKSGDTDWENETILLMQQLTSVLGEDYIKCIPSAGPAESFLNETRRAGKYSFMRCNWGADYLDPQTWTDPFEENFDADTGDRIGNTYNRMDLMYLTDAYPDTVALLDTYYAAVKEAKAEAFDLAKRYNKFAEAEAMLINNALVVPYYISPAKYQVTKLNIFEGQYAAFGNSTVRFKGQKVYDHYITMEEYEANLADWLSKVA